MAKLAVLTTILLLLPSVLLIGEGANLNSLMISPEDIVIEESAAGGYHLWIKKKAGLGSVLLTESTQDLRKELNSYALRNPNPDNINSSEKRLLNGQFLEHYKGILDSTPEDHVQLGQAFHLYIPYVVEYGYPWSRQGELQITAGSFINIKAFAKPYADWTGPVYDNPFVVALVPEKEQTVEPEGDYNRETVASFKRIAKDGGGKSVISPGKEDLIPTIGLLIDEAEGGALDLVLALDTTLSMKDEFPHLRRELVPMVREHTARFDRLRVGLLLYREYFEQYLVKTYRFVEDLDTIQANIDKAKVHGGREIPEAVFEALYAGIESYSWQADARLLILTGDAPPHPRPRGKITVDMVYSKASESDIVIHTIILPQ